jgi:hypothetical protein
MVAMQAFLHALIEPRILVVELEHGQGLADGLFGTIAGQFCEDTVDPDDHLVPISHDHAFFDLEGNGGNTQSRLALFQHSHHAIEGLGHVGDVLRTGQHGAHLRFACLGAPHAGR